METPMVRVRERDLIIPSLQLADNRPGGFITTTDLIGELEAVFQPEGDDAAQLDNRNDTRFSQKVRNLISHRESGNSMFTRGYAIYMADREGIKITEAGRHFLAQVPDE
jgi:hypothetical protein